MNLLMANCVGMRGELKLHPYPHRTQWLAGIGWPAPAKVVSFS